MERLREEEVRQVIREWVKSVGTIARASKIVGVTPAYMSDVVRGARAVGIKIPAYLGYTHVEYWEKPDAEAQNTGVEVQNVMDAVQSETQEENHEVQSEGYEEGKVYDDRSRDWF
jgi:hypothetical protein